MLKVIRTDMDSDSGSILTFKGVPVSAEISKLARNDFVVEVDSHSLFNEFADCRFADVSEDISILVINVARDEIVDNEFLLMDIAGGTQDILRLHVREQEPPHPSDKPALDLNSFLVLDASNWNASCSPNDYLESLKDVVEDQGELTVKIDRDYDYWIRFRLNPNQTSRISDEVNNFIKGINRAIQETEKQLNSKKGTIVTKFQFPEGVSTSCEQYLLYFVQFLRDVGVEADSELKHDAGKVLFSVTPIDQSHALDKVRAALDEYLRLPSSPIKNTEGNEIAVQRLESTVLRLHSDLRLAAAELQAKSVTLDAQQLAIGIYKGILSGEVVIESLIKPKASFNHADREVVLDGLAAITVLKKNGIPVEVNLPKLYRMVKGWFTDKR